MKAYIYLDILCPSCNYIMVKTTEKKIVFCSNPRCHLHGKKYIMPSIEIKELKL